MNATIRQKNPHAVALGRLGGKVKSPAKKRAAQENGKKGGRPVGSGFPRTAEGVPFVPLRSPSTGSRRSPTAPDAWINRKDT
jgi:hypothetical protein